MQDFIVNCFSYLIHLSLGLLQSSVASCHARGAGTFCSGSGPAGKQQKRKTIFQTSESVLRFHIHLLRFNHETNLILNCAQTYIYENMATFKRCVHLITEINFLLDI